MRTLSFRMGAALILCAALATGTAWAKDHDHGHERGRGTHPVFARDNDHDRDNGFVRQRDRDRFRNNWRGDGDRDDMSYFRGRNSARPPGWSHGRKMGWGNCDMPPGQARKYGCNSYFWQSPRRPVVIVPRTQRYGPYRPWYGRDRDHHGDHDGDRD